MPPISPSKKKHLRAERLVARYSEETGNESFWYDDQDAFTEWLTHISEITSERTFAVYRRWMAAYAVDLGFNEFAASIRCIGLPDDPVPSEDADNESSDSNKDIAIGFTEEHLTQLASLLMSQRGDKLRYQHGLNTYLWFQLIMMTGIRPSEWREAVLLRELASKNAVHPWVLEVTTAAKGTRKVSAGDMTQSTLRRKLVLDNWTTSSIEMLQQLMDALPTEPAEFARFYESIRQTLIKASQVLGWGPAIGLYTARHIFASEVRRQGKVSRYALAAMLGHSDTVNQRYYGDITPSEGQRFDFALAEPWPDTVLEVERTDRERYSLVYGSDQLVEMLEKTGQLTLR